CTLFGFFFSSRRRHTRFSRDWSSDVCSSDLVRGLHLNRLLTVAFAALGGLICLAYLGFRIETIAALMVIAAAALEKSTETQLSEIGRASCRERVEIGCVSVSVGKRRSPSSEV